MSAEVPALFSRVGGNTVALSWPDFDDRGIMTASGHTSAREAATLVLMLPVLIFSFGVAVAIIAALV